MGGKYISLKIRLCPRPGDFMVQPFHGKPPGSSRSAPPGERPRLLQDAGRLRGLSHTHLSLEVRGGCRSPRGPQGSLPSSQAWQDFPTISCCRELPGL